MWHSRGSWLPLRRLQSPQAVTTFSHVVRPPRLRGITWSKVRSCVGQPVAAVLAAEGVAQEHVEPGEGRARAAGM